jgi:hypothetical protein
MVRYSSSESFQGLTHEIRIRVAKAIYVLNVTCITVLQVVQGIRRKLFTWLTYVVRFIDGQIKCSKQLSQYHFPSSEIHQIYDPIV